MTALNYRKLLLINIFLQPLVSTESINDLPYSIQVKIILSVSWLLILSIGIQSRSRPDTVETGSVLFLRGYSSGRNRLDFYDRSWVITSDQ